MLDSTRQAHLKHLEKCTFQHRSTTDDIFRSAYPVATTPVKHRNATLSVRDLSSSVNIIPEVSRAMSYMIAILSRPQHEGFDPTDPQNIDSLGDDVIVSHKILDALCRRIQSSTPIPIASENEDAESVGPSEDSSAGTEQNLIEVDEGRTTPSLYRKISASAKESDTGEKDEHSYTIAEIRAWLAGHCSEILDAGGKTPSFDKLDKLLEILRLRDQDNPRHIEELFEAVKAMPQSNEEKFGPSLPLYMLKAKFELEKHSAPWFSVEKSSNHIQITSMELRHLAFLVVQSIHMASYLGIQDVFVDIIKNNLPRSDELSQPSVIDFLDLLHHTNPRLEAASEIKMSRFCQTLLDVESWKHHLSKEKQKLCAELPIILNRLGNVALPVGDGREERFTTTVPRLLYEIVEDTEHTYWIPEILEKATTMSRNTQWPFGMRSGGTKPTPDTNSGSPISGIWSRASRKPTSNDKDTTELAVFAKGDLGKTRSYTGYFRYVPSWLGNPAWDYFSEDPKDWSVVHMLDSDHMVQANDIKKHHRTIGSQWSDFAEYIRPDCRVRCEEDPDGRVARYFIELEHSTFTLESKRDTFELTRNPPAANQRFQ